MVGRARELAEGRRLLREAEAGTGGLLVLRGEGGIGKTRLIQELAGEAARRKIRVAAAEASLLDRARPFGAVADALGVSARSPDASLAELARRIDGYGHGASRVDRALLEDIPVEVHRLVEDLVGVFESRCTAAPLMLLIDNLHWLDNSSLVLLRRLAPLARQYPALIVLTSRPSDRTEVAATVLAAQRAGGTLLDLGPLADDLVLALAGELAGHPPGARLASPAGPRGGQPALRGGTPRGAAAGQAGPRHAGRAGRSCGGPPPASLTVSILHRLALLPRELIELLRVAAVCGHAVDPAELALLSGRDALEVAESLRAAERAGIMEVRGEHLWFRHELIHDALYNDWPRPVARGLHQRARHPAGSRQAHHPGGWPITCGVVPPTATW